MIAATIDDAEARRIIGVAHASLSRADPRGALEALAAVEARAQVTSTPLIHAVLWGLIGDACFRLDEVERGLAAYHESLAIDPGSPCAETYASEVASRGIADEALRALAAMDALDAAYLRQPFLVRCWRSIYALFVVPSAWFHGAFARRSVKRKLRGLLTTDARSR